MDLSKIDKENCNIKILAGLRIIMSFVAKQSRKASWKNYGNIEILAKGGGLS